MEKRRWREEFFSRLQHDIVDNYGDFSIKKSRNRKVLVQTLKTVIVWKLTFLAVSHKTQNFDNGHKYGVMGYLEKYFCGFCFILRDITN